MHKTVETYSSGSKFFHWIIALIVIVMLSFGFFMDSLPFPLKGQVIMIHKSFGLTVLALMILRLVWLFYTGKPPLPGVVPAWQRILAHIVQHSLYVFVILMSLCGWMMSVTADRVPVFFGLFKVPLPMTPNKDLSRLFFEFHSTIAWILIALIILHICGALKEHFIDKDNVLLRMLPGKK